LPLSGSADALLSRLRRGDMGDNGGGGEPD
jgi:hypothetical protein